MKDLTPLFETSQSSRTRALLQAGRSDLPPAGFSDRLLVGLGVGVAVSSVSVTAAATASAAASGAASMGSGAASLGLVAAKWVAVGVIGGGILAGGADLALTPKRPAPAEPSAVDPRREAKTPRPPAVLAPPALASAQPGGGPVLEAEAGEAPVVAPSASERGRLAREVQLIDRARRALAAGDAARALAELDELERRATSGVLDREAWILRIEALHLSGQTGRARQLAARYREAFPNDAHAARLRALEEEKP